MYGGQARHAPERDAKRMFFEIMNKYRQLDCGSLHRVVVAAGCDASVSLYDALADSEAGRGGRLVLYRPRLGGSMRVVHGGARKKDAASKTNALFRYMVQCSIFFFWRYDINQRHFVSAS